VVIAVLLSLVIIPLIAVPSVTAQSTSPNETGANGSAARSGDSALPDVDLSTSTVIDVAERARSKEGVSVRETDGYTIITPEAGVRTGIRVGTNEIAQNVLVDLSADGSNFRFNLVGQNPAVRNIGFTGESTVRDEQVSLIHVGHDRGVAYIANIYAGDGGVSSNPDDYAGAKMVFVNRRSGGPTLIRGCNVGGFADNGIYASAPGIQSRPSSGEPVYVTDCYAQNSGTANYRLGSNGSMLINSISVLTDQPPGKQGAINNRGLWAREQGTVVVRDTVFYHPYEGDGAGWIIRTGGGGTPDGGRVITQSVRVAPFDDSRLGGSGGSLDESGIAAIQRDLSQIPIPEAVPASAVAAASGSAGEFQSVSALDGQASSSSESDGDTGAFGGIVGALAPALLLTIGGIILICLLGTGVVLGLLVLMSKRVR
jgi:hypothetical protein